VFRDVRLMDVVLHQRALLNWLTGCILLAMTKVFCQNGAKKNALFEESDIKFTKISQLFYRLHAQRPGGQISSVIELKGVKINYSSASFWELEAVE
jgi:hypothetical protein